MFYTNQSKKRIEEKFKAVSKAIQEISEDLLNKIIELTEKNKSLSERLVIQDNRIDQLEALFNRVSELEIEKTNLCALMGGLETDINKLKIDIGNDKIYIENKFIEFRKETLDEITGKFFDTLDRIFRTSKEISLISTLINTNGAELGQLRSQLLRPYVDAKHREERIKQGEEIVNKGQKIIETRNKLYEEMIERQRKGENISNLKTKIEVYDEIIKSIK